MNLLPSVSDTHLIVLCADLKVKKIIQVNEEQEFDREIMVPKVINEDREIKIPVPVKETKTVRIPRQRIVTEEEEVRSAHI